MNKIRLKMSSVTCFLFRLGLNVLMAKFYHYNINSANWTKCLSLDSNGSVNSLQWRHNDHDGVSNHLPHGCLLNRLFRSRSKKTSKLRVTGRCVGNSPGPVNSPHKGPVTRKMFPFDYVIMVHFVTHLSNILGHFIYFEYIANTYC